MGCTSCGDKPTDKAKDFTKAVIEIDNPGALVLLRKVVIPASMGDDKQVPPAVGKYRNVILQYEANKHVYIYSSDGIPTFIEAEDTSGGDSDIIELTRADYNYPEDNPNSIALWKLESGIYRGTGITVKPNVGASITIATGTPPKSYFYIKNKGLEANILCLTPFADVLSKYKTNVADGARISSTSFTVLDTLTSTRDDYALSANQGKVLDRKIGDLSTLVTTNKSSAVAAINEIASGGGGQSYTAGDGIDITNNTISVDTDVIQPKLTAGNNITITGDTISATDTTYSNFVGTDGTAAGTAGLVPAPAATDAGKFLKADGSWDTVGGSSINVVQSMGTSTTDVMSQNATTTMIHPSGDTNHKRVAIGQYALAPSDNTIAIGFRAQSGTGAKNIALGSEAKVTSTAGYAISIGSEASCSSGNSTAIGTHAKADFAHSVAIGDWSQPTRAGELNVGTGTQLVGYQSTSYRVIGGVHDPVDAHDAATKGYVDTAVAGVSTNTINSTDWSALWQ